MAPKPDKWMPLDVAKYLGDTSHLNRDQHGAYLLLLMAYWMRGGPLQADDRKLAAICKASPQEWKKLKPVLEEFFTISGGYWSQKRADQELARAREIIERRSVAGKSGAAARWQTHDVANGKRMANAMANEWQNDGPLPLPLPIPLKKKELEGFVVGRGGVRAPMSEENKLALFQKWLAETIGVNGWRLVGEAANPESPNYAEALAFCRDFARKHGKGWPHKWPTPKMETGHG